MFGMTTAEVQYYAFGRNFENEQYGLKGKIHAGLSEEDLIRRAKSRLMCVIEHSPPSQDQGGVVYTQAAGISYALARVGAQINDHSMIEAADSYLHEALNCAAAPEMQVLKDDFGPSIFCGHAGTLNS